MDALLMRMYSRLSYIHKRKNDKEQWLIQQLQLSQEKYLLMMVH